MFLSSKEKKSALCIVAVALTAAVLLRFVSQPVVEAGSWGLSFQQEGQTPTGTVSQQVLGGYDAAYVGDTAQPVIYLTFDAGYENGYTAQILDVLAAHQVSAAFFIVGNYLEQNPDLVRRMVSEGHTVGNHTYHHYDMSQIAEETAFRAELESLETLYTEVTGEELPRYYRPPQGCYSEENLEMAQALGYHTVFWSLAYVDWYNDDQPTADEAFSKLIGRIHNGAVVLLHATSKTNAEILDELLTRWESLGYRFGTLDELFDES
jgi:peptidoglycan-N-acetylmuramic acid deacetylase